MVIFHSTLTWKHWVGLILTSAAYAIPYQQLFAMAKPTYADDGDLIDGGFDMSTGGICGYVLLMFSIFISFQFNLWFCDVCAWSMVNLNWCLSLNK